MIHYHGDNHIILYFSYFELYKYINDYIIPYKYTQLLSVNKI